MARKLYDLANDDFLTERDAMVDALVKKAGWMLHFSVARPRHSLMYSRPRAEYELRQRRVKDFLRAALEADRSERWAIDHLTRILWRSETVPA